MSWVTPKTIGTAAAGNLADGRVAAGPALILSFVLTAVACGFTGETDSVAAIYGKVLSDTFSPDRVIDGLGRDLCRAHVLVHGAHGRRLLR